MNTHQLYDRTNTGWVKEDGVCVCVCVCVWGGGG